MSNAMVLAGNGAAMMQKPQAGRLEFSDEQRQMIRDMFANGATDQEFAVLMEIASARKLNPILKQIHFVKRWDPEKRREVWSAQTGIDGFRVIAERTGQYDGQDEPEFEQDAEGNLVCAKVRIYRKGISRPFVGVARYREYVQTNKEGQPTRMWRTMPYNQLAKCAESAGFRKAFPEDLSGLYTAEEMAQADNPVTYDHETGEVYEEPPPRRPMKKAAAAKAADSGRQSGEQTPNSAGPGVQTAAEAPPAVDDEHALCDDMITSILDSADQDHIRSTMQRSLNLPQTLRERVLLEGVKRLLDLTTEPADVERLYLESKAMVADGHVSNQAANAVLKPVFRARQAPRSPAAA